MAYNDDTLKAKLATLNETQESIVSVAHWINFHRRYADRIAQMWLARLKEVPPPKRLNFIYLVNDIVQNARARKRPEFPNAFAPIIADAIQQSYRSATADIQNKIKRVVEVWGTRAVFEESILTAIQGRIDEVDKSKGGAGGERKKLMGNSLFSSQSGSSMPKELETLAPLQTAVGKANLASKPLVESAQSEYVSLIENAVGSTSAPVHAANLSSLIKKLASAEASLNETITARKSLVEDLRRITKAAENVLAEDETTSLALSAKRTTAEIRKRDVEDSIMRGLSETPQQDDEDGTTARYDRPDVEELTPEPEDQLVPDVQDQPVIRNVNLQGILAGFGPTEQSVGHAVQIESTNTLVDTNGSGPSSSKKRKLSHDYYGGQDTSVPDLGEMGVGFDGMLDAPPSISTNPAMSYLSNNMSFSDQFNPGAPQIPALTSTLEQDVDALIKGAQPFP